MCREYGCLISDLYNAVRSQFSLGHKTPGEFQIDSLSAMKRTIGRIFAICNVGYAWPAGSWPVASDQSGRRCITLRRTQFDVS